MHSANPATLPQGANQAAAGAKLGYQTFFIGQVCVALEASIVMQCLWVCRPR